MDNSTYRNFNGFDVGQFQTCPTANPLKFLYAVMNSRRKSLSQKKKKKKKKKKR